MNSWTTFTLSSLILASAAQALPLPAPTAEEAAQAFCQEYLRPVPLGQMMLDTFQVETPGPAKDLEDLFSGTFVRRSEAFERCSEHLGTLANALDRWGAAKEGQLPERLEQLVPEVLEKLPQCPAAGQDTYLRSYRRTEDGYRLFCQGRHHRAFGVAQDQPSYDSVSGLQGRPAVQLAQRSVRLGPVEEVDRGQATVEFFETTDGQADGAPVTTSARLYMAKFPEGWMVVEVGLDQEQRDIASDLIGAAWMSQSGVTPSRALQTHLVTMMEERFPRQGPLQQAAILAELLSQPGLPLFAQGYRPMESLQDHFAALQGTAQRAAQYWQEHQRWPDQIGVLYSAEELQAKPELQQHRWTLGSDGRSLDISAPYEAPQGMNLVPGFPQLRVTAPGIFRAVYWPASSES